MDFFFSPESWYDRIGSSDEAGAIALLKQGVNLNVKNSQGETPLYTAVLNAHSNVVKFLLEHGANPNSPNKNRKTPLYAAAWYCDEATLKLLLQHGANPNVSTQQGETPLHRAAWYGRDAINIVRLLLKEGADPNARNSNGETPLHWAAWYGDQAELAVKLLLEKGADPNAVNKEGEAPLHKVGVYGYECKATVQLLLEEGANPHAESVLRQTPLHYAAELKRHAESVFRQTPLDYAVELKRHDDIVKLLFKQSIKSASVQLRLCGPSIHENSTVNQNLLALLWGVLLGEQEKKCLLVLKLLLAGKKVSQKTKDKELEKWFFIWNRVPTEIRGLICTFLFEDSMWSTRSMLDKNKLSSQLNRDTLSGLFVSLLENPYLLLLSYRTHFYYQAQTYPLKALLMSLFQKAKTFLASNQANTSMEESNQNPGFSDWNERFRP